MELGCRDRRERGTQSSSLSCAHRMAKLTFFVLLKGERALAPWSRSPIPPDPLRAPFNLSPTKLPTRCSMNHVPPLVLVGSIGPEDLCASPLVGPGKVRILHSASPGLGRSGLDRFFRWLRVKREHSARYLSSSCSLLPSSASSHSRAPSPTMYFTSSAPNSSTTSALLVVSRRSSLGPQGKALLPSTFATDDDRSASPLSHLDVAGRFSPLTFSFVSSPGSSHPAARSTRSTTLFRRRPSLPVPLPSSDLISAIELSAVKIKGLDSNQQAGPQPIGEPADGEESLLWSRVRLARS